MNRSLRPSSFRVNNLNWKHSRSNVPLCLEFITAENAEYAPLFSSVWKTYQCYSIPALSGGLYCSRMKVQASLVLPSLSKTDMIGVQDTEALFSKGIRLIHAKIGYSGGQELSYILITIKTRDGDMRRLQARLSRDAAACPETIDTGEIINWQYLRDGSMIELYQIETTTESTISAENIPTETLAFERFDTSGEYLYVYHRARPNDVVRALIELIDTYSLVIDLPITFGESGVTVTLLGETDNLQAAYEEIPEPIKAQTTIERIRSFSPVSRGLSAELTTRQRQLLDAAITVGYYSVPREATVEDVAEVAECAPSTAAEHLRKLESRVFTRLAEA